MLKTINLQDNFLTDSTLEDIIPGMRQNSTCRLFTLTTNSFSDYGKKLLNDEKKNIPINRARLII